MAFDQVIQGSSANTGKAVIPLGKAAVPTSSVGLCLPSATDLSKPEGVKALNDRLRQIEQRFQQASDSEVGLAIKLGYGTLGTIGGTAKPVPNAKVSLDKLGNWLILISVTLSSGAVQAFAAIDATSTDDAKAQVSCKGSGATTCTGYCFFTATSIPRLAQLYVKGSGAAVEGTHIGAIWLGKWKAGDKRFGRQTENRYTNIKDANGQTLTAYGEEAQYPPSDHPATLPKGVDLSI